MITCKEDLVGTYIAVNSEKDAKLVQSVCENLGIEQADWQGCEYVKSSKFACIGHSLKNKHGERLLFSPDHGESEDTMLEFCNLSRLEITDLLPTSYENTKVYSLDEDVIRKYAELCGKKYGPSCIFTINLSTSPIGVINYGGAVVCQFAEGVMDELTTLTTEQILASWDFKFNSKIKIASIRDTQAAGMVKDEPKDGEYWLFEHARTKSKVCAVINGSILMTVGGISFSNSEKYDQVCRLYTESEYQAAAQEIAELKKVNQSKDEQIEALINPKGGVDVGDLCEKYFWIIDDCKNNPEYRLSVKMQLSTFSRELESLKQDKQPKKTVEYVKCEFDKLWKLLKAMDEGEVFYYLASSKPSYEVLNIDKNELREINRPFHIYRRTEVEVDWRDEGTKFIDEAEFIGRDDRIGFSFSRGYDFDDEGYDNEVLELCRVALRATGELK